MLYLVGLPAAHPTACALHIRACTALTSEARRQHELIPTVNAFAARSIAFALSAVPAAGAAAAISAGVNATGASSSWASSHASDLHPCGLFYIPDHIVAVSFTLLTRCCAVSGSTAA